jgi:hypothetical protein
MNATVIRRDGPSGRFYEVDGELFPSVTHILTVVNKPALVPWAASQERKACLAAAADLHDELGAKAFARFPRAWYLASLEAKLGSVRAHTRTMEHAGDIGSEAHRAIEWILRTAIGANAGPEPLISAPALIAVNAFRTWAASVHLKPVLIERVVYSRRHRYAGTIDLLARVDGTMTQISLKTGKAVYAEAFLQEAGYQAAMLEMGYRAPDAAIVLRLPKTTEDPGFEAVPIPTPATLLPAFLAARELWEWQYAAEQAYRARTRKPRAQKATVTPIAASA